MDTRTSQWFKTNPIIRNKPTTVLGKLFSIKGHGKNSGVGRGTVLQARCGMDLGEAFESGSLCEFRKTTKI